MLNLQTEVHNGSVGTADNSGIVTFILPAHWASYLINGDASSFSIDPGEAVTTDLIDTWLENEGVGACVDCSQQSFFTWHPDFPDQGGDCLHYTFKVKRGSRAP